MRKLIIPLIILMLIPLAIAAFEPVGSAQCHTDTFGPDTYIPKGNYCWGDNDRLFYRHSTYTWSNEIYVDGKPTTYKTSSWDGKFTEAGDPSGNNDAIHGILYDDYLELIQVENVKEQEDKQREAGISGSLAGSNYNEVCKSNQFIRIIDITNGVHGLQTYCTNKKGDDFSSPPAIGDFDIDNKESAECDSDSFMYKIEIGSKSGSNKITALKLYCKNFQGSETSSSKIIGDTNSDLEELECPSGEFIQGFKGLHDSDNIYSMGPICAKEVKQEETPKNACGDIKVGVMGASNIASKGSKSLRGYPSFYLKKLCPSPTVWELKAIGGYTQEKMNNKLLQKVIDSNLDVLIFTPSGNSCEKGHDTMFHVEEALKRTTSIKRVIIMGISTRKNSRTKCAQNFNQLLKDKFPELKAKYPNIELFEYWSLLEDPNVENRCAYCNNGKSGDNVHWDKVGAARVALQLHAKIFNNGGDAKCLPTDLAGIAACIKEPQVTPGRGTPPTQSSTQPVAQTINQQCSDPDQCKKIDEVWLRFSPLLNINKGVYVAKQGWTTSTVAYGGTTAPSVAPTQPGITPTGGTSVTISNIDALKTASVSEINSFITKNLGAQYIEDVEYLTRILSIERGCSLKWEEERGAIAQVVINRVKTPGKWGDTVKAVVATNGGKSWFGASSSKIQDSNRGISGTDSRDCLVSALKFLTCQGLESQGATEIGGRTHFVHRCTQEAQGRKVPSWNYDNPLQVQSEKCAAHFSGKDTSAKACSVRFYKGPPPTISQPAVAASPSIGTTLGSTKILAIGDSHSAHYYYGKELHQLLINTGTNVNSYAIGGSVSKNWIDGRSGKQRSSAGFIYSIHRAPDGSESDLSSSVSYSLNKLISQHNPGTIIISLGTNSVGKHISSGTSAYNDAGKLAKIASTSANCIWVGPPQYKSRDLVDIQNAAKSLKLVVEQNGCKFIDSTTLTDKSNMADSVHYNSVGGKAWAEKVYSAITTSFPITTTLTAVPTTWDSEEYVHMPYPDALNVDGGESVYEDYFNKPTANGARPTAAPKNMGYVWIPKEAQGKSVDLLIALHGWRSFTHPGSNVYLKPPGQTFQEKDIDLLVKQYMGSGQSVPIVIAAPMHDRGPKKTVFTTDVYDVNTHITLIEKELATKGITIKRVSLMGHSNANCGGSLARAAQALQKYPLYMFASADGTCDNQDYLVKHLDFLKNKATFVFHMHQSSKPGDDKAAASVKKYGGITDPNVNPALKDLYRENWVSNDGKFYTYNIIGYKNHFHGTIPNDILKEVLPRFFKPGGTAVAGPTAPQTPQAPSKAGITQTYKSKNNGNRNVGYITSTTFNKAQPVLIYFYLGGQGSSIKKISSSQKANFNTLLSGKNAIIIIPQIPYGGETSWYKNGYDQTIDEIKSKLNFNSISSIRFAAHSMGGVAVKNILSKATTYTPEKIILLDACSASWCTSIAKSNIPMNVYQNKNGFGNYGRNEKQIKSELGGYSHVNINVVSEKHNTIPIKYLTKIT
jgi:hypothetical protein